MNISKFNIRSAFLNFYLFPFRVAIKFPLLVHRNVIIRNLRRGCIKLENAYPGMIQIGYNVNGIFDYKRERTLINISDKSKILIKGRLFLGLGSSISTNENAQIVFGNDNYFNGRATLISSKMIAFGDNNLISWNCTFMDTDFHSIYKDGFKINDDKEVLIGNRVWIGMNSTILKGVEIVDNVVIGSNSFVSKDLGKENCIYAGSPAVVIKDGIEWKI